MLRRAKPWVAAYWKNLYPPAGVLHKLTLRCNARCRHCDIWNIDYGLQELSTAEVKSLYAQIRRFIGPYNLVITGGEALVRSDSIELARYAAKLGLLVEFLTNGYLLADAADELAHASLDRITISFDGATAKTVNAFRGKNDFYQRATDGIKKLAEKRSVLGGDFQIWLKTVVMRHNIEELVEIARLAKRLGIEVCYQPIEQNYGQLYDPSWRKDSELWPQDVEFAAEAINELMRLKEEGLPIVNSKASLMVMESYFRHPDVWMRKVRDHAADAKASVCLGGVANLEILPDGKVKVCGEGAAIGDCRKKPLRDIWRNRPACWKGQCTAHQV
jgi:MoaA/NifB/PqqE/SkfB family radical SAM enzyme